jgi:hypothetical protein
MKSQELLDEILQIIRIVKDDQKSLTKILGFLQDEIDLPDEYYEVQLPEKYNEAVVSIADSIDAGLVCFLNTDTLETDDLPQQLFTDPSEYEAITGMTPEDLQPKYTQWKNYITIEPLESGESFRIMEKFTAQLNNLKLRNQLIDVLKNRRPFANFKKIVESSVVRQDWFDFKAKYLQNYVKSIIEVELQKEN